MAVTKLKKSLTFIEAIALVVGGIIGSGIFLKPGIVFNNAGSPMLGLMAWVVGGIVTLAAALTIAEIASAIPKTGGLYVYLEDLFGDIWGFLLGWVQTMITFPASAAALAIAFATFSTFFVPMTGPQQKLLAIGAMLFVALMNIIATKLGGVIQTVATVGKLLPIAAIIGFGLIWGDTHDFSMITTTTAAGAGFGAAVLGTLWAYDGWIEVTNVAEEFVKPNYLSRALFIGVSTVVVIYMLVNVAMLNVIPGSIISSERPASDIAVLLFGPSGAAFITAGIMISVFGAMNAYIMTGARVPFAMGDRRQLPCSRTLAKVHPKFKTPANALIFQAILTAIYILSGTFNTLTDLLVFVLWIFFSMGVFGIFILRKKSRKFKPTYRVPLYPWVPLIGLLGGSYIVFTTIIGQPMNSLIGIGITLVGIPVFYYSKNK
jgi:APA family basic amino acid/polyamine antiporter